jgi:hypothetical protein
MSPSALALVLAVLLAGCGGSASPAGPGSSAVGSPGLRSASPSATSSSSGASASDEPSDAGDALANFREFVTSAEAFHVDGALSMRMANRSISMDMGLDIAGSDERGTLDLIGFGTHIKMQFVVAAGIPYVKVGSGEWMKGPETGPLPESPLKELNIDGLVDVGQSSVNGVPARHLQVSDPTALDIGGTLGGAIKDVKVTGAKYDIYVRPDGTPITVLLDFDGTAAIESDSTTFKGQLRYDFSKFGEPVEIEAPI